MHALMALDQQSMAISRPWMSVNIKVMKVPMLTYITSTETRYDRQAEGLPRATDP